MPLHLELPSRRPFPASRVRRSPVGGFIDRPKRQTDQHPWTLDVPRHKRWQPTGDRGLKLLERLVRQRGWMLTPID